MRPVRTRPGSGAIRDVLVDVWIWSGQSNMEWPLALVARRLVYDPAGANLFDLDGLPAAPFRTDAW